MQVPRRWVIFLLLEISTLPLVFILLSGWNQGSSRNPGIVLGYSVDILEPETEDPSFHLKRALSSLSSGVEVKDTFMKFTNVCIEFERSQMLFHVLFYGNNGGNDGSIPSKTICQYYPHTCRVSRRNVSQIKELGSVLWVDEPSILAFMGYPNFAHRILFESAGVYGAWSTFKDIQEHKGVNWWLFRNGFNFDSNHELSWSLRLFDKILVKKSIQELNNEKKSVFHACFRKVVMGGCGGHNARYCKDQFRESSNYILHEEGITDEDGLHEESRKIILISRKNARNRRILGLNSVIEALEGNFSHLSCASISIDTSRTEDGFNITVLRPEELTFGEQVSIVHRSAGIIGVHGAGLAHAFFLRNNSIFLEVLPWGFTHHLYTDTAFLVANASATQINTCKNLSHLHYAHDVSAKVLPRLEDDTLLNCTNFIARCKFHVQELGLTVFDNYCRLLLLLADVEVDSNVLLESLNMVWKQRNTDLNHSSK